MLQTSVHPVDQQDTSSGSSEVDITSMNAALLPLVRKGDFTGADKAARQWLATDAFFESPATAEHAKFCLLMDAIGKGLRPCRNGHDTPSPWWIRAERICAHTGAPMRLDL